MIEGHGDDTYRYGKMIEFNFSSNIRMDVDHSKLMKHLMERESLLTSYPEPEPYTLGKELAQRLRVFPENILITNGAVEGIYLIALAFIGSFSAILEPTFNEYRDACELFEHQCRSYFRIKDLCKADLAWICNPNNPTGKAIEGTKLLETISANPRTLFIVDQAYHNYTSKEMLTPSIVRRYPNVVILQSLTKDFSVPGLRIGYIVADAGVIRQIQSVRMPWSVNSVAIEAARYLLKHEKEYEFDKERMLQEAEELKQGLRSLGIKVYPSDSTFMLCKLPRGSALDLKTHLAQEAGILIREASNFHSLTPQHFRVASQNTESNLLLVEAIKDWLK